ncbi:MAG TPA: rod shape-determining protein RodA [Candidatus Alistipes pullicola]|nr:rod shape-determining protein RodA [Candidatus Alistipes pullicola]
MKSNEENSLTVGGLDWITILVYTVLVLMGWVNIYAAVYDEAHSSIFDISQRYGMQLIWIGVSAFIAISILLIDDKYYHILAYPLYWFSILVLIGVLLFGKEVNGAKSWLFGIQPSEFVKFTTALALARYMSSYSFDIRNLKHLLHVAILLGLPVLIVMLQNDTGSALVFGSFLFMLYREGFNGWVYIALIMIISLFIFSFLLEPTALLIVLILVCVVGEGMTNGKWRSKAIYLAGLALGSTLIYTVCQLLLSIDISWYLSILIAATLSIGVVILYAYRYKINNILTFILLFFGSLGFTYTVDYVFNNALQIHQQKRILDLLGLESDLSHWGYNVNQSKIAIGSGGFSGKGFLEGTQTKFNFVPEQSTDFIFCTVGEEWGFIGSAIVIILFVILILRLIRMGERQQEPFGRIYCYCVASVFLFHITINIGMTIGIMPVIGIPLPFFSYGGSSLIAFTILLFVAIKLDASKHNELPFVN